MKLIVLFFVAFFTNFSSTISTNEYTLEEALQKGVIQLELIGNSNSTHYEKPILATLKNNIGKKVVIRIISGYRLESIDNDVQDILTTQ